MNIDWKAIRPLNGGQEKSFEELCSQLARAESPKGAHFTRKGTPDAGVECYTVLKDDSEWCWQAKYFDALGDPQWAQIDKSVNAAIVKHPRMVRYFICTPLDRPDARIASQKSAMAKWNERVIEWKRSASQLGMTVEFVFWGSSELLERLTRPEHVGRVRFWFDVRGFDAPWFSARLEEALLTAGPRYTPEVHVELPIAREFEAFCRTEQFFERQKAQARAIHEKLRNLEYPESPAVANINEALETVSAKVHAVLTRISAIKVDSTGLMPFKDIAALVKTAEEVAEKLRQTLKEHEREFDAMSETTGEKSTRTSYRNNPFHELLVKLDRLSSELRLSRESLIDADGIADSAFLILRGIAGSGKTHLLCDIARQRINVGRPTVLLMGQQFVNNDAPWSQALKQLDLAHLSAEEFVGALEAAAQAAGSRALLVIDAINEGAGRIVWPNHLAAFLAHLERSPWIGVVLAIKTSYEEIIIPEDVRARATTITHHGFMDHEYDAMKTFFIHYGLELPTTPLLEPEFRNPLFLKTHCLRLKAKGESRLPRGFHGITAVFDLYLSSVNERLASNLDFDKHQPLVRRALEDVTVAILDSETNWLPLAKAVEIVDNFLPGRDYARSLYRGLVVEGVIVEDALRNGGKSAEVIVFVGYERFADLLAAKTLLDRHLDHSAPASSFEQGRPLAFVCDEKKYVSPGLLEALCIQVPERTGKELITLAPACEARWGLGNAFRQSLVWRDYSAFSDGTDIALNNLCQSEHDLHDTIDVLLTVAMLPSHPLNAEFLDRRLRRDAMPDRDAWWSVFLHHTWETNSAVDRIVDWASALNVSTLIDEEAIGLCAISITWMLTSSNRFLRDRATKALVNLLTDRLPAMTRLVERFSAVNDPYVAERVYAVAYGVAMRSHDREAVGALAKSVYSQVFSAGSPPPHILLRDYARGVVERALVVGSEINVVHEYFRPPYKSVWPTIPTEEDIKPFLPDWSKGSHDSGELEWGRNRIGNSVMVDDFARYVIGTNSSCTSSHWLQVTQDETPWQEPFRPENLLHTLVRDFSEEERQALEKYYATELKSVADQLLQRDHGRSSTNTEHEEIGDLTKEQETKCTPGVADETIKRTEAVTELKQALTEEHRRRIEEIWILDETDVEAGQRPGFDLSQIKRYILKRVFDMGWTEQRFGQFDRYSIGHSGRTESKAERIGKKYQWIAYHEILAYISDRFQYHESNVEDASGQGYKGPWQCLLRDIDPSFTLRSVPGGTSWDGHANAWWDPISYDAWNADSSPFEWLLRSDDLPNVEDLLLVTNPKDGSRWLNCSGFFNWKQKVPSDRYSTDFEQREIWYMCSGHIVRNSDVKLFMQWAKKENFWGRWFPEAYEIHDLFLGEYPWAPASRNLQSQVFEPDGWIRPGHSCPVRIQTTAVKLQCGGNGFDCSMDESPYLRLPSIYLIDGLGVQWSGHGADFVDASNQVAAYDPTAHSEGPDALLLQEDLLHQYLKRADLTMCWTLIGEKRVLPAGLRAGQVHPPQRFTGAFVLTKGKVDGNLVRVVEDQEDSDDGGNDVNGAR